MSVRKKLMKNGRNVFGGIVKKIHGKSLTLRRPTFQKIIK
jgi:hypothetical protein